MSWRDQLQMGKFRGVAFLIHGHDASGGRRLVLNEYPKRDEPYAEDLGRKAREFSVELYVLGSDYMTGRDALLAAFEQEGPGTLQHPYLGSRQVAVREYRLRENSRDGGMATFSVTFVEAGRAAQPSAAADTRTGVLAAVDGAIESFKADFSGVFDVASTAGFVAAEAVAAVELTFEKVARLVGDVTGPIAALIRAPANMAAEIAGGVAKLRNAATGPRDALKLYAGIFDAGSDMRDVPVTTPARRQQAQNQWATQQLVRRTAVAEAARSAAAADFTNVDEALASRAVLVDAMDELMGATDPVTEAPISHGAFDALRALRAAVVEDLRVRGAKLPRVNFYTPAATAPARVLAYRIYGDATRADEIVARNKIRHPGFVPGGVALEVLSDG